MIIEITINPKGETTVQTHGFAGSTCRQASRLIEEALGEKVSDVPTAEMYRAPASTEQVKQR